MRTETKFAKQCINGRILKTSSHMTFYFEQVTYAYSLIGEGKALGRPVPERWWISLRWVGRNPRMKLLLMKAFIPSSLSLAHSRPSRSSLFRDTKPHTLPPCESRCVMDLRLPSHSFIGINGIISNCSSGLEALSIPVSGVEVEL